MFQSVELHIFVQQLTDCIGIPMGLNFYDLLPFWYAFFHQLGFCVLVSPNSTRELYAAGQQTIPSDTACYPAKLMHGHMEWLLAQKPDAIFYPDMSYNVEEGLGVDHFNCPVVAYYPQVLKLNVPELQETRFISDFIGLHDKKSSGNGYRRFWRSTLRRSPNSRSPQPPMPLTPNMKRTTGQCSKQRRNALLRRSRKSSPSSCSAGDPITSIPRSVTALINCSATSARQ